MLRQLDSYWSLQPGRQCELLSRYIGQHLRKVVEQDIGFRGRGRDSLLNGGVPDRMSVVLPVPPVSPGPTMTKTLMRSGKAKQRGINLSELLTEIQRGSK